MQILKFLKYLPALMSIIDLLNLIRAAEDANPEPGSGTTKREQVQRSFTAVVSALRDAGLVSPRAAGLLIGGAETLITLIVTAFNAIGVFRSGSTPDAPDAPSGDAYERTWPSDPREIAEARALYADGDVVWRLGPIAPGTKFSVTPRGIGIQMPPGAVRVGEF